MNILDFLRQKIKPNYKPYNRIEVSSSILASNYRKLKELSAKEIIPVLKSNAYGHGLKLVAKILDDLSIKLVAVDSFPEAQVVWKYSKAEVLFLSELPKKAYKYCPVTKSQFCVSSVEIIDYLAKNLPGSRVHIFVNTGMNREGFKDLPIFKNLDKLKVVGLGSHLAGTKILKLQLDNFLNFKNKLKEQGIEPENIHFGGTEALESPLPEWINSLRVGLAFYGYGLDGLKPALKVISTIIAKQKLSPGEGVSYGPEYIATEAINIALVPFGYFEGLDRGLSAKGKFFIGKRFYAPLAGRVCMNLSCFDCANNDFEIGEEIEIISPTGLNSLANLAQASGTLSYELLVRLNPALRRVLID